MSDSGTGPKFLVSAADDRHQDQGRQVIQPNQRRPPWLFETPDRAAEFWPRNSKLPKNIRFDGVNVVKQQTKYLLPKIGHYACPACGTPGYKKSQLRKNN